MNFLHEYPVEPCTSSFFRGPTKSFYSVRLECNLTMAQQVFFFNIQVTLPSPKLELLKRGRLSNQLRLKQKLFSKGKGRPDACDCGGRDRMGEELLHVLEYSKWMRCEGQAQSNLICPYYLDPFDRGNFHMDQSQNRSILPNSREKERLNGYFHSRTFFFHSRKLPNASERF